jgi:hypothetical protein
MTYVKAAIFFTLVLGLATTLSVQAQLVSDMDDESRLYAETKQVNQFFRRFNGEEDDKGERYDVKDRQYQSVKLRKKYLGMLFDASNAGLKSDLKTQFGKDLLEGAKPIVLDFHGGNWFAEVHTTFMYNNKAQTIILFLTLEKDHLGTKWVIDRVHADMFDPYFKRDTTKVGKFLHPLSHELDFMNLRKAFQNTDSVSQFAGKRFVADHLSVFLYEIKKGSLKFKTVDEVKFHFFQIPGWYFELSEFNRPGNNNGWLISNLVSLKSESERNILRKYLYYETK